MIKGFKQFNEEKSKSVVFTFGRFNPPTTGHEKLLIKVASLAIGNDYKIFASQTNNPKKDPLQYKEKVMLMRKMFPKHGRNIVLEPNVKNAIDALVYLYDRGYTKATMVVGADRISDFKTLLNKYNGVKARHGFYEFTDGISIVSAGDRDPDADDVSGMSASKMRAAAIAGDFQSFANGLPKSFGDKLGVFNLLRKRMGLKEMNNFRKHVELKTTDIRERYIAEEVFLVGDRFLNLNGEILTVTERRTNFIVGSDDKKYFLNKIVEMKDETTITETSRVTKHIKSFKDILGEKVEYMSMSQLQKMLKKEYGLRAKDLKMVKIKGGLSIQTPSGQELERYNHVPKLGYTISEAKDCWDGYEKVPGIARGKRGSCVKKEDDAVEEGVDDPAIFKAVFLAGGPGSGKSFTVGKTALTALGFKVVNSDDKFEVMLKKADLEPSPENIFSPKGQKIRGRAKELTAKQQDLYINGRLGLVIDGTGKDYAKIKKQADLMKTIGYDVAMIFVNTDLDTALERNRMRARSLPDDTVTKMWKDVQNNLGKFQQLFSKNFVIVDNSSGANVAKATTSAYKQMAKFAKEAPKNNIAKKWVSAQLGESTEELISENKTGIENKAKATGISYSILKKVFDRGVAAWKTGHRPGTTPSQWGFARINSFVTGGKTRTTADKDLWSQHSGMKEALDYGTPETTKIFKKNTPGQKIDEGEGKYEGETWEQGYKRRVVKTADPDHTEKGYKWRIKGKERSEISIKLYKEKPSFKEYSKQMERVAGHEFGK